MSQSFRRCDGPPDMAPVQRTISPHLAAGGAVETADSKTDPVAAFQPGTRVRDRIWGGTDTGTVIRVDTDDDIAERLAEDPDDDGARCVYVKWDATSFTDSQHAPTELEPIAGAPRSTDTEVGVATFTLPEPPHHLGFGWTR